MRVINLESTPNPNAIKYILDAAVVTGAPRAYANADEAARAQDLLGVSLFKIPGVTGVYAQDNFVTVAKTAETSFHALHPHAVAAIEKHGAALEAAAQPAPDYSHLPPAQRALMEKINKVLDEDVRPALAGDGGGLVVAGLEGDVLKIRYQGACGSCPSSTAGTVAAIQNVLRFKVKPELSVVPV